MPTSMSIMFFLILSGAGTYTELWNAYESAGLMEADVPCWILDDPLAPVLPFESRPVQLSSEAEIQYFMTAMCAKAVNVKGAATTVNVFDHSDAAGC